ncbi:hypothetical protein SH501x_002044 [Pirellulaceae bacterium SH501]
MLGIPQQLTNPVSKRLAALASLFEIPLPLFGREIESSEEQVPFEQSRVSGVGVRHGDEGVG